MIASGSLVPIKRPFLRKSSSSQGFYDHSTTAPTDYKNEQGKASTGY
jgi:hypothetical protein